jgi:hypothetical protein
MSDVYSTSENYDYLYEKLEEFYNVSVTGNYPFNIPLNENGQPLYKFESRIVPIDFDKECEDDIVKGTGFYIVKKQNIKKDIRSIDSIFSSRFGMQIDDVTPFGDVYKCKCGKTMMKVNNGLFCPFCHTKVRYVANDFSITGWIKMNDFTVIHPNMFKKLVAFIGKKIFDDIINVEPKIDEDGFAIPKTPSKSNPFSGIGFMELRDRFDEVMEFYRNKYKSNANKMAYYEDIMQNKNIVFTHCLPVYTSQLRPFSIKQNKFNFEGNNALYNLIAGLVAKLNKHDIYSRNRSKPTNQILYDIQMKYMEIYADLEKVIAQKKGYTRSLNGGRYNFTARNVIIPDPDLRIDEVILPYPTLIELMSLTIINVLTKTYSPAEAYRIWDEARIEYNPMIADLIQNIIDNQYVGIILNRNPSISPSSIIQLHVIGVTKNDTYSCHLPHEILKSMGADFDGDTLNITLIINDEFLLNAAKLFNPRLSMQVSYNDGMFNSKMSLQTDTMICINSFAQLGINSITEEELRLIEVCQSYQE